jgi:hypothetical protein
MNFMPPPLRCLSIVGLSLTLAACDTPPTVVDQHFGMAVQRAQAQQSLLAPQGTPLPALWRCPTERAQLNCPPQRNSSGQGTTPGHVQGMGPGMAMGPGTGMGSGPHSTHTGHSKLHTNPDTDGASALSAVTRYQQSFQTPPAPTPIFNIGLGAISAP